MERPVTLSSASGRNLTRSAKETRASGQPDRRVRLARVSLDRGANGSIHGGSQFKPHGWLMLTLLTIYIDIATL